MAKDWTASPISLDEAETPFRVKALDSARQRHVMSP